MSRARTKPNMTTLILFFLFGKEENIMEFAKLDKAATAADDSERAKKVFQNKADEDEKRISGLEKDLKEAREKAEAADASYDEVQF